MNNLKENIFMGLLIAILVVMCYLLYILLRLEFNLEDTVGESMVGILDEYIIEVLE